MPTRRGRGLDAGEDGGEPRLGIDIVHLGRGNQAIEDHRPLPLGGDTVAKIREKNSIVAVELTAWQETALSTDLPL